MTEPDLQPPRRDDAAAPPLVERGRHLLAALWGEIGPLPPASRAAFDHGIDRDTALLLPVLGPVLGAFVILFGAWDAWVEPDRLEATLRVRVVLVAAGALGYFHAWTGWPPATRCLVVYVTHVAAMTISAALLDDGLMLALPGLTGAMFLLALVEPRPRHWSRSTLPLALLFLVLARNTLPEREFVGGAFMYVLSWLLAAAIAVMVLRLRRRAFDVEQALLHASRHDSLSGALARGYLTDLALHDVSLARRHGRPLAVAMIDIDHFKRVNDLHGHAAGDAVLCALVGACTHSLRGTDYLGRVGGEEFVCVMPEASSDHALACAERMRKDVEALRVPTDTGVLNVTVSIGVSVLNHAYADWYALLRAADGALYRAKAGGRNRCVLAAAPAHG